MNQFSFWIFENQLNDIIIFLKNTISDIYPDLEHIKYELSQTDIDKEIHFNLYKKNNIIINITRDSDDKEIIVWFIDYSDEITEKISEIKLYLSSI